MLFLLVLEGGFELFGDGFALEIFDDYGGFVGAAFAGERDEFGQVSGSHVGVASPEVRFEVGGLWLVADYLQGVSNQLCLCGRATGISLAWSSHIKAS